MLKDFSDSVKTSKQAKTVFLLPGNFEKGQFLVITLDVQPITSFNALKKRVRAEQNLPIEKRNTWVGFIPYDTGEAWYGMRRRSVLSEVYFLPYQNFDQKYVLQNTHFGGHQVVPGHQTRAKRVSFINKSIPVAESSDLRAQTFDKGQINFLRHRQRPSIIPTNFLSKTELIQPYFSISKISSNLSKSAYLKKIKEIKEYLRSGDTYQVNFSQRFSTNFEGDPLSFFLALSQKNPSPHQFFADTPKFSVISNSPERLVKGYRKDGRFMIETRPIKGTVPRGLTPKEDARNIEKLLASEKEKAELVMIVDLERNDLGKICVPGTVCVTEHRTVEKYSHVIHTVSNIEGELSHGRDVFDVLEAVFPGGSITGCPKKRTMEIIAELENSPRGVYCGSAGIIFPDGSFDFNIMIRTAFIDKFPLAKLSHQVVHGHHTRARRVCLQNKSLPLSLHAQTQNHPWLLTYSAGGGVVIDSDPEREYEETLHKAQAFFEVLR